MTTSLTKEEVYDMTIIGGGPTGLFAAFYGGLRGASVKLIESLPHLGGQLSTLYPEKDIFDVGGFPRIRGQALVDNLIKQMNLFPPAVCLDERVLRLEKRDDDFHLVTTKGEHFSRTVIITAGIGAFEPRKLPLKNIEHFESANLHYFVKDMNAFEGKTVMVAGGGDSAVDWALMLEPIAKGVVLVHRREQFRAHEQSVNQLMASKVQIMTPYEISALEGEHEITTVHLFNKTTKEETAFSVDALLVNYGFVSSLGPIAEWGLDIEKGSIVVNSRMETNIPGVYAAGDIVTYPGKIDLIATGFGEAPTAVSNAKHYLDPETRVQPAHSSSMNL